MVSYSTPKRTSGTILTARSLAGMPFFVPARPQDFFFEENLLKFVEPLTYSRRSNVSPVLLCQAAKSW